MLPDTTTVVVERLRQAHVISGTSGPRGAQGIPGPAGDNTRNYIAAGSISAHRLVLLNINEQAQYADAFNAAHVGKVVGLSLTSANNGEAVTVAFGGDLTEPTWAFTPGAMLYLGVSGALVESPPVGSAFTNRVGQAISATRIFLSISEPIRLT